MEEHGGLINDCANDEKGGERMSSFNTAYLIMTDPLRCLARRCCSRNAGHRVTEMVTWFTVTEVGVYNLLIPQLSSVFGAV